MWSFTRLVSLNILLEDLLFLVLTTGFLYLVGWGWRNLKPYTLPLPFPQWYKFWFLPVQVGGLLPLLVLVVWQFQGGGATVSAVLLSYLTMLGLQILAESITLRQFQSVVWVMVPYLYLPYRIWQLAEGLVLVGPQPELLWIRGLLIFEIVLWTVNYLLDLSQLPRLFRAAEAT